MLTTLFLTAAERPIFEKLPSSLKEGWTVTEETGTVYETDYELMVRANMLDSSAYPELAAMSADLRAGKKVNPAELQEIPEQMIPEILFAIGARGISVLMQELGKNLNTDDDVRALASFSFFRHDIFEANAAVLAR